eukprot:CAMPEP_0196655552 /NCGR_PEP_ID=MMETSP1086-20130531/5296_1 /TAXON_ID=77921 /ORGANISM="Cyanoptyche  gloeocystis , Strain SAG4.97" /LENGTH=75 /DNA_ID=CAMNT_0041987925 /DNA_START=94 /DNA_END=321 /DNA_ORIENTATION=+
MYTFAASSVSLPPVMPIIKASSGSPIKAQWFLAEKKAEPETFWQWLERNIAHNLFYEEQFKGPQGSPSELPKSTK